MSHTAIAYSNMRPPVPDDRYQRLVDKSAFGVFRSTLDGRFVDVNQALVDMLGYDSAEELLAADAAQDIYREAEHRDALIDDIRRGRSLGWLELPWRKKSGVPITVRLTVDPARNDDGTISWLDGLVEDLTEQRRRDEIVRRNERMASLGKMLAGVAHELNNPLAAIGGFAQILVKAKGLAADDAQALRTIHRESVRAAKIVKSLLDFARRPEAERAVPVDVNAVARYALDSVEQQLVAKQIRGELDLAPQLSTVRAQPSQIEQVVVNLVVNARQALETWKREDGAQHALGIRTRETDGWVVIEVWDNGPGIRADHRSRIWDPFWTTHTDREGSGLGLSVVHGIVTAYGGTIDVATLIGQGTRFLVKLPAGEPLPAVASGS
jgi:PAS domain S-box-containing protein